MKMAKGRRLLTSTRSDRLLGLSNCNYNYHNGQDEPEFGEAEVWSMVENSSADFHHRYAGGDWASRAAVEGGRSRWSHQRQQHVGGPSLAFDVGNNRTTSSSNNKIIFAGNGGGPRGGRHVATSAPVSVPDWSKILGMDSGESMAESDEEDRVGDLGMEPPHEYLARSRKMNPMSVFEGVGRTLKGRDMSRVRDAVWSQTGFEG